MDDPSQWTAAVEVLSRAVTLDASFASALAYLVLIHAVTYLTTDNDAEARDAMTLIAAMGGQTHRPHFAAILARLAQRARRFDDAVGSLQASLSDTVRAAGSEAVIAGVIAATAERSLAPRAIDALDSLVARIGFEHLARSLRHQILSWYTELGALDKAYAFANDVLDHLARQGTVGLTWSGLWLREMREFRRDRRFEPFAARMGLAEYWNRFGPPDEGR
jgi:hypothetical protein